MNPKSPGDRPRRQSAASANGNAGMSKSLSFCIVYGMVCMMGVYVAVMIAVTRYGAASFTSVGNNHAELNTVQHALARASHAAQEHGGMISDARRAQVADIPSSSGSIRAKGDDHHHPLDDAADVHGEESQAGSGYVLTAYVEHVDQDSWNRKPLPVRDTAHKDKLMHFNYPKLNSCQRFMEQFPVDDYPEGDAFLPWIHDVFPTSDGKYIQFIAQNRRRCHTGTNKEDQRTLKEQQPQVSLFQHVAVKRVGDDRYRLSSHEEADEDGMATRFICRFKPSMEETLSVFNVDYEYASFRKGNKRMFSFEGRKDNKFLHTTQLIFQCPVPEELQDLIRSGASVQDDFATQFVDLIPIRTPPRYGPPTEFLKPYYKEEREMGITKEQFNATAEWGTNHILPRIEDSGRWENIPICKPSLMAYEPQALDKVAAKDEEGKPKKAHKLVSCLWASTGYSTRGQRFTIGDGERRLLEFITYYRIIGFDHFYLYDNSNAFGNSSLQSIADKYPEHVTIMKWPSKVCNNNPNNVDSVGERSSQYAAESSCRLRFGPHVDWIGQFDIDEYLVPMGEQKTILPLLDKLDEEGKKIISFDSWRAWPRRKFIETPVRMHGIEKCGRNKDCFNLHIPMNQTMLQAYNCDRQKPGEKTKRMPAEKQLYRPDYVKQHFIHFSTITHTSELNKRDVLEAGLHWRHNGFPDPLSRFGDEVNEGLMLHTKAVATQDTIEWETVCKPDYKGQGLCRLGTPFPDDEKDIKPDGDDGWAYNCYINKKVDNYFVPLLEADLKKHVPEIAEKLAARDKR